MNTPIDPLSPTVDGLEITYSVSPNLPTGLSIDSATGVISGTPTDTIGQSAYTVTATNNGGSTTFDISMTVLHDVPAAPIIGTAIADSAQATVTFTAPSSDGGSAITPGIQ